MTRGGEPLAVGVLGASGRMGTLVCRTVEEAPDLRLVARVGSGDSRDLLRPASVLVDFTHPDAVMDNIRWAVTNRRHIVVGTSGIGEDRLQTIRTWLEQSPDVGVLVVPTFAISAVFAMNFAARVAAHYDSAEIIEYGHAAKVDAPSGTAHHTAKMIAQARGDGAAATRAQSDDRARGINIDGVWVHSLRMEGFVFHQTVLLSRGDETLEIHFDTRDRSVFMPSVLRAVRAAPHRSGLTFGLGPLLEESI